jgi:GH25 family lysozyme M1 (1,4-beta-N-acetylmuramidase)
MFKGIDIAKWNTVTDYEAVRKSGVEFAIPKVINASNKPDDLFTKHVMGCKAAQIPCSMGYTYSYANTRAKATASAQAFVNVAKPYGITYMWLDLEDAIMQNLKHTLVDIIDIYRTMANNNGMNFGIYTYSDFYTKYIKPYISELKDIPFWIARYPSKKEISISDAVPSTPSLPSGINIKGWQYTSNGKVDGIKGHTDIDVWYDKASIMGTQDNMITSDINPFTEPSGNCKVGTLGNDANWCLWYLWRFGKLLDSNGQPDSTQINGVYSKDTAEKVKEVQGQLGLTVDGIVGKQTRTVWKKLA